MCLWCCWFRSEERHTVVEEENCSVDVVVAPHMTVTMFWFSEKKKKKQKKNLAPPQTFPLLLCFCDDVTVVRALVSFCKDVYFHYCVCNFVVGKRGMKMRRLEKKKHEPTQKQENGKSEALCDYSIVRTQNRNRNRNQTPGFLSQTLITDYYIPKNWIK